MCSKLISKEALSISLSNPKNFCIQGNKREDKINRYNQIKIIGRPPILLAAEVSQENLRCGKTSGQELTVKTIIDCLQWNNSSKTEGRRWVLAPGGAEPD